MSFVFRPVRPGSASPIDLSDLSSSPDAPHDGASSSEPSSTANNTLEQVLFLEAVQGTDAWSGEEVVAVGTTSRPNITVRTSDEYTTVLGRNQTTKIADVSLSRALCEVWVDREGRAMMRMRKGPNQHRVCLNGHRVDAAQGADVELMHGSRLSLNDRKYEYAVQLSNPRQQQQPQQRQTPVAAAPAAENDVGVSACPQSNSQSTENNEAKEPAPIQAAQKQMVEEVMCSVCMDVMVRATVVNPCGHTFCGQCVRSVIKENADNVPTNKLRRPREGVHPLAECPNCREGVMSATWLRSLDNVIWSMCIRGDFDEDDARHYIERSGKKPTEKEMRCIFASSSNDKQEQYEPKSDAETFADRTQNDQKRRRLCTPHSEVSDEHFSSGYGSSSGSSGDRADIAANVTSNVAGTAWEPRVVLDLSSLRRSDSSNVVDLSNQGLREDDAICLD